MSIENEHNILEILIGLEKSMHELKNSINHKTQQCHRHNERNKCELIVESMAGVGFLFTIYSFFPTSPIVAKKIFEFVAMKVLLNFTVGKTCHFFSTIHQLLGASEIIHPASLIQESHERKEYDDLGYLIINFDNRSVMRCDMSYKKQALFLLSIFELNYQNDETISELSTKTPCLFWSNQNDYLGVFSHGKIDVAFCFDLC